MIRDCVFRLVRQPLHDASPSQRLNARHLPSIPLSKLGGVNGPLTLSNAGTTSTTNRFQTNQLFLQTLGPNSNPIQRKPFVKTNKYNLDPLHTKPRTITIVKQGGEKPHRSITILLNRRTVQTYDQLLSDISEAFGYQKNRQDKVSC